MDKKSMMVMFKTKICTQCHKRKKRSAFWKDLNQSSGLRPNCIQCCIKNHKPWVKSHRKDKQKYDKKRREQLKDIIKLKKHLDYLKNKEYIKAKVREWERTHKKRSRLRKTLYVRERRRNDLTFNILSKLRSRLYSALNGIGKKKSTIKLLGCTIEELKIYLEAKFKPGMNWNNYGRGGWVIDHIKPCSLFNLKKLSEQKACFHYTNCQPLWEDENIRKGNKFVQN